MRFKLAAAILAGSLAFTPAFADWHGPHPFRRDFHYYHHGHHFGPGAALGLGILGGAILGGTLLAPPVYAAPQPYYPPPVYVPPPVYIPPPCIVGADGYTYCR